MNLTATPLRSLANSLRLHYDSKNRSQIFQHVENFSAVGEAVATPLRMSATDSEVNATVLRLQIVQFAMESQSNSQKCKRGLRPGLQISHHLNFVRSTLKHVGRQPQKLNCLRKGPGRNLEIG